MKEQIPPILRPEHLKPVPLADLMTQFAFRPSTHFDFSSTAIGAVQLTGISMNTNDLRAGDLFVAMPGLKTHGARFAAAALEKGAVAIITDSAGEQELAKLVSNEGLAGAMAGIPVLLLENPRSQLGELAAQVYRNTGPGMPDRKSVV